MTHMDEQPAIRLSIEDCIATVALNRPGRLNALDISTTRLLRQWAEDAAVRVLILTGAGRGFCARGDMHAVWNHVQSGGRAWRYLCDLSAPLHKVAADLRRMPKPVIACPVRTGVHASAGIAIGDSSSSHTFGSVETRRSARAAGVLPLQSRRRCDTRPMGW
jgi:2-(1,2-epoxy-1,2-dihydrophenyl)acetyl-CoA isomerase